MRTTHAEYSCTVVTTLEGLAPHLRAWEGLQSRTLEDNFYFSPGTHASTLRHFNDQRAYVVFVYKREARETRLVACAPFSLSFAASCSGGAATTG